jgi:cytochrome c oxidase assembly factor CtaG
VIGGVHLAGDWSAPPGLLLAAAIAAALFTQAFVRVRRRGRRDLAPWTRAALFGAGLSLTVLPLVSPLDAAGEDYLLSMHMLQHVLIGDAAAALLVLSVRGPLVVFLVPAPLLRRLARVAPLRALLGFLLRPAVAFALWTAAMLGWHVPAAYDAAVAHPLVHELEHASFVIAGTLAWTQLVDPAREGRLTRGERIAFAFGLLVAGQPVMDALLFSGHAFYGPYAHQPHRLLGLSPLTDQRLAGAVMLVEQLLTLGTCIAVLLMPLLRERRARVTAREAA